MFKSIIEVVESLSMQIIDKITTIPYAVRQFCKCVYQHAREKFA